MVSIGKFLIICGLVLVALGVIFTLGVKLPWFGRFPGDIYVQRREFTFIFPITTCIIISVILSLILMFFRQR
jgi:hypothetical protein